MKFNPEKEVVAEKFKELNTSIEQGILLCNTPNELVAYACLMLTSTKKIFDMYLGTKGRNVMLESAKNDKNSYLH